MKAVLFDLDGTILDTRDMILNSFRYAYTTVIGEDTLPPDEKLLALVGIPLAEQMELLAPGRGEELCKAYRVNNALVHKTMLRGFEGTEEALESLLQKGLRLAIITSKMHESALQGLTDEGLADYFEFLLGADDTPEHKPKPGPLLMAAERMGFAPEDCAYVGDSPYDMQAARSAGMFAAGVLWGGMFTEEELLNSGAQIIVPAMHRLPEMLPL